MESGDIASDKGSRRRRKAQRQRKKRQKKIHKGTCHGANCYEPVLNEAQFGGFMYSPGDSNNYIGGANVAPGMTTTSDSIPKVNMYGGSTKSKRKK
jgi:hypothetical protein